MNRPSSPLGHKRPTIYSLRRLWPVAISVLLFCGDGGKGFSQTSPSLALALPPAALLDAAPSTGATTLNIPMLEPSGPNGDGRVEFLPPNLPPFPRPAEDVETTDQPASPTMSPDDILFVLEAWRLSELNPHFNIKTLPEWTLLYRLTHPTPTPTALPTATPGAEPLPGLEWTAGDPWPSPWPEAPEEAPLMLDINDSAMEELMLLGAGLDARRAAAIVSFRDTHGPFRSVDALSQVFGVTDFMVDRWRPFLYVDRRPTVPPTAVGQDGGYASQFMAANMPALPYQDAAPTTATVATSPTTATLAPPPPAGGAAR